MASAQAPATTALPAVITATTTTAPAVHAAAATPATTATTTPPATTTTTEVPPKIGANARTRTPANADFMADELYLNNQLDDLLADLGLSDFAPKTQTSPETKTAPETRAVQLSKDALNDDTMGSAPATVDLLPAPAAIVRQSEYQNVSLVPIQDARPANDIPHEIPVGRSAWFSNDELKQMSNMTRGAAQSARREGSLHSSVLHVLGVDELYVTEVPALGPCVRVAQAILCASTGAMPSHAPVTPNYDVRVTPLDQFDNALALWPGYTPFFAPADMPDPVLSALLTLFLPGGAGAFTWRFRPGANPIADGSDLLMPSAARWLAPGGSSEILVVTQGARQPLTIGGGALTLDALWALERWIKNHWDSAIMDQAWKTAIAASQVYARPANLDGDYGVGVDARSSTTRLNNHELNKLWGLQSDPPPLAPLVRHRFIPPWDRTPDATADALWTVAIALGIFDDGTRSTVTVNWGSNTVRFVGRHGNHQINEIVPLPDVLAAVADPDQAVPPGIRSELLAIAEAVGDPLGRLEATRDALPDEGGPFVDGVRNVYGFSDEVTIGFPGLDLRRVTGLFIGAHVLTRRSTQRSYVDRTSLRARVRRYAAHLHLVSHWQLAERDVWPDDLAFGNVNHASCLKAIPKPMANFAIMSTMSREFLAAPNWQVLESSYVLRSGRNKTAYFGFQVEGTWYVDDGGRASVSGKSTSFPAIEAAVRDTWNHVDTVDVAERTTHDFKPVRGCNGLFNSLGIAPRAEGAGRRPVDITIAAGRGILSAGSNKGGTMVATR